MGRKNIMAGMEISIPEARYKADLELHDRFLQFSSDLLKLSLGGIGVTGFLITLVAGKDSRIGDAVLSSRFERPLLFGIGMFGLSAAAAMVHRFLAADGMYHHLRAIKLLIAVSERRCTTAYEPEFKSEAAVDERARSAKFKWSEIALMLSAAALVLGASSTGWAFVSALPSATAKIASPSAVSAQRVMDNRSPARPEELSVAESHWTLRRCGTAFAARARSGLDDRARRSSPVALAVRPDRARPEPAVRVHSGGRLVPPLAASRSEQG